MRVLEQHRRRGARSGGFHHVCQRTQCFVLVLLRRHWERSVALVAGDGQDGSNEPDIAEWPPIVRNDQCFELVELRSRRLVACELQHPLEVVDERIEGAVDSVG